MTETNRLEVTLLRRGAPVHTETIFIIVGASVAGVLAFGALLYVLIRCCPKRRQQASGLEESRLSRISIRHSRMDSFVQSPPFIFPGTPSATPSGAQEQDPRLTSTRRSSQEVTGVAVAWDRQIMSTGHVFERGEAADIEPPLTSSVVETGTQFPDMSGLKRRSSVPSTGSVYSKASLPISQQSFGLESSSPSTIRSASMRPTLQTIPASPYGTYPPRPVPQRSADSRLPPKSILKTTAQPLSPAPNSNSPRISVSSTVRSPRSAQSSGAPASPYEPRVSQASPLSRALRRDEPPASPFSNATEATSQSGRPSPGHPTSSPVPVTPPSAPPPSERSTEPLLHSSHSPLSPLAFHSGSIRRPRPEPLRIPRESYASVMYARSRAPSDASDRRRSARPPVRVPTPPDVPTDTASSRFSSSISGEGPERLYQTHPLASEQVRFSPSPPRPLVRSPTWSMFRGSPGYI